MHALRLPPRVVTRALRDLERHCPGALDEVWSLVYRWFVQRAGVLLRNDRCRSEIEADDLVHDAFLKLRPEHVAACHDRWHLIRVASRAMREVLIDRARRRRPSTAPLPDDLDGRPATSGDDLLDLALAIDELGAINGQLAAVASLRCFGGLKHVDIGRALGRGETWARMGWAQASAWLHRRLGGRAAASLD